MSSVNLGRVVGYSAYEIAVQNGFVGTEAEWLASLKGNNGADGQDGSSATIQVGTVSTGAAGTDAVVTNVGTSSAAVFNFTIPQGPAGTTEWAGIEDKPFSTIGSGLSVDNGVLSATGGGTGYTDEDTLACINDTFGMSKTVTQHSINTDVIQLTTTDATEYHFTVSENLIKALVARATMWMWFHDNSSNSLSVELTPYIQFGYWKSSTTPEIAVKFAGASSDMVTVEMPDINELTSAMGWSETPIDFNIAMDWEVITSTPLQDRYTPTGVNNSIDELWTELDNKQNTLTAGTGISIENNVISATGSGGTTYTAGTGIAIDANNEISVDTNTIATQRDLASGLAEKQDLLTAGEGISIRTENSQAATTTIIENTKPYDYTRVGRDMYDTTGIGVSGELVLDGAKLERGSWTTDSDPSFALNGFEGKLLLSSPDLPDPVIMEYDGVTEKDGKDYLWIGEDFSLTYSVDSRDAFVSMSIATTNANYNEATIDAITALVPQPIPQEYISVDGTTIGFNRNGELEAIGSGSLPSYSSTDAGKVLSVNSRGELEWVSIPSANGVSF